MAASPNPRPLFVLVQPRADRLLTAAVQLLIVGVFGWMAVLGALQFWAPPRWTNQRRAEVAAVLVAPLAVFWTWRGYVGRYHTVVVRPDAIELRKGRTRRRVRPSDVLALVGDGGIDLGGGDLIVWKRLSILTAEGRDVLEFHQRDNAAIYRALHATCPRAWGLPFPARLEPPDPAARPDGAAASRVGLGMIGRSLRRRIGRNAALGLGLVVGCLAVVWLVSRSPAAAESAKGLVFPIVGVVVGMMLMADAVRCSRVARTVRRMENG